MSTLLSARHAPQLLLVGALLAVALIVALPQIVSAQPPPPAVFFGSTADITVDGGVWDGSTIQIIDQDGDVIGQATINGGSWSAEIMPDVDSVRFRVGSAVSQSFAVVPGSVSNVVLTIGGGGGASVSLLGGFNFLVWRGATMLVSDGLASFPNMSNLSAIFEFSSGSQSWSSYRPGLPAGVQGISELRAGGAYFFLVTGGMTWEMPTGGDGTGTQTIVAGFTAIGWVGPDGDPQDVLDAVGAVAVFFRFNASTQSYESFRPGLPAAVQGITTISQYDVFFFSASSSTSITQ